MRKRYRSWGEFLKKKRGLLFRSAREFCGKVEVGISYPQYSRYEAGEQLPSMEAALSLCQLLKIQPLEGLMEWNRAQIADTEVLQEVDFLLERLRASQEMGGSPLDFMKKKGTAVPSEAPINLDEVLVLNRSHLKLFSSDPAYRDIFTFVNAFNSDWVTCEEIGAALGIETRKVETMVGKLHDLGVLVASGSKCRSGKSVYHFPDDAEFFDLRNINLSHNFNQLLKKLTHEDYSAKAAYRALVTRELDESQHSWLTGKLEELRQQVLALPVSSEAERVYSLCLLMGERFRRQARKAVPRGLTHASFKPTNSSNTGRAYADQKRDH